MPYPPFVDASPSTLMRTFVPRRLGFFYSLVRHILQFGPWLIAGIVGATLVLLVVAALFRKRSANAPSKVRRSQPSGPDNLNYVCAGCGGQFAHSRRTIAAWERGTQRFYCNVCHKKWRNQQPPPDAPPPSRAPGQSGRSLPSSVRAPAQSGRPLPASAGAYTTTSARAQPAAASRSGRSGCLTVVVLAILLPVAVLLVATHA
jgi:hypothetical protein